jgi:hypothetical protein
MMDIARFYGIPVLSQSDVLYPSWVRFFLTHPENNLWPYSQDGLHSSLEGCKVVAEHVLKPFFLEQMTTRESDKLYETNDLSQPYPIDLQMFRSDQYKDTRVIE